MKGLVLLDPRDGHQFQWDPIPGSHCGNNSHVYMDTNIWSKGLIIIKMLHVTPRLEDFDPIRLNWKEITGALCIAEPIA